MLRYFFVSSLLFFSFCVLSQPNLVQGPFKIDGDDTVFIQREIDINYPLALYFKGDSRVNKSDTYEVNGSNPNIETVFFTNIKNDKNIIFLISWQQKYTAEGISRNSYQVYGYTYNENTLIINRIITNDPKLSGLDGEYGGK